MPNCQEVSDNETGYNQLKDKRGKQRCNWRVHGKQV